MNTPVGSPAASFSMVSVSTGETVSRLMPARRLAVGDRHQGQAVAPEAPDGADENRVVRRRGVKLLPRRPTLLGEDFGHVEIIGRIADRHRHDPRAGLCRARQLGDAILDVANRAHRPERRIDALEALAVHVGVAVDQSRHHRPAPEVDDARIGCDVLRHRRVGADGEDARAGNRDRLRDAELAVDGDNPAVAQDQVGGGRRRVRRHGLRGRRPAKSRRRGGARRAGLEHLPAQHRFAALRRCPAQRGLPRADAG
jgi:hypothetical protein